MTYRHKFGIVRFVKNSNIYILQFNTICFSLQTVPSAISDYSILPPLPRDTRCDV